MSEATVLADALAKDERIAKLKVLLKVAKCPDPGCEDGVIQHESWDGHYDCYECQWCHERKALTLDTTRPVSIGEQK